MGFESDMPVQKPIFHSSLLTPHSSLLTPSKVTQHRLTHSLLTLTVTLIALPLGSAARPHFRHHSSAPRHTRTTAIAFFPPLMASVDEDLVREAAPGIACDH